MVRDGVANIVIALQERGYDPRRVGDDAWEVRCPAHRSSEHALSITRNEHNHVVLDCRSAENCPHTRIIGALGLTNELLYAETADWLISRLKRTPIQPATFASSDGQGHSGKEVTSPKISSEPVHSIAPLVAENVIRDSVGPTSGMTGTFTWLRRGRGGHWDATSFHRGRKLGQQLGDGNWDATSFHRTSRCLA